ncbi:Cysteine protease atg4 [Mortierella sp. NVP85]|nr:Cysteine protease atg4 [Mortierella sp. NVP85]
MAAASPPSFKSEATTLAAETDGTAAKSTIPAVEQGLPNQETPTLPHNSCDTPKGVVAAATADEKSQGLSNQTAAAPQKTGIGESPMNQGPSSTPSTDNHLASQPETPAQVQQADNQESMSSRLGSRFSVNLSGLQQATQANSERAADMAQDIKKNVVNMWHAWFPTPSASASTASTNDAGRLVSGTQSLNHHPHQPHRGQRVNSYTMGFNAGSENLKALGTMSADSASATGTQDDFSISGNVDSDPMREHKANPTSDTTRIVHDANDPIASRSSTCGPPPSNVNRGPIYLMGKLYPPSPTQWAEFQQDFTWGLIWCTYRHGYAPIRPSNFVTDVGWGCMLRSGQGLLANALAVQFMGRGWNRPFPGDHNWDIYVRILSWFLDDMNAKYPFSVHRIALLGKQLGKNIGQWFGPSTTSQVIQALVHNFPGSGLNVYVTTDGVIYKNQVEEAVAHSQSGGFSNLLILVTIRLGIDKLNPIYNDAIKATFEFPQTLGIAGGRPSSSYYFVGYQGNDLFYLDPHHSRSVVESKPLGAYTPEDLASYHCEAIRKIDITAIDPSMLLAFYCRDRSEFDDFCERVRQLNARPGMGSSIFTIGEKAPDYEDDNAERLLSVADEEDEDLELIL